MLGSQTLAGAYSLARSTIGQMAVRIALECSEADAHLILSDDNPAARLAEPARRGDLQRSKRPGRRQPSVPSGVAPRPGSSAISRHNSRCASSRNRSRLEPAIVFEGNVPANPLQNEALVNLVTEPAEVAVIEPTIWLGSAVRIEPPTQMTFRRQGGNNLLVVGQDEPLALGILSTAVAAIAAQSQARNHLLTEPGTNRPIETPGNKSELRWAKNLDRSPRDTGRVIAQFADEVVRRTSQAGEAARSLVPDRLRSGSTPRSATHGRRI